MGTVWADVFTLNDICKVTIYWSLDRLILNFPQFIIKLKPMLGCKIAEIAMKRLFLFAKGGNDDIMRQEPTLVYDMQYNLDILSIVFCHPKN